MKLTTLARTVTVTAAALALALVAAQPATAQKEPIRIATTLDFTAVYTFATAEYAQGQADYISLVNERGGIQGHPVELLVSDHGNEPQRGIEAYERAKEKGAVVFDFLSTPVSRAIVPRALEDHSPLLTLFHGRADSSDGQTFPYIFPATPTYWSQAALITDFIRKQEEDLSGKKIAFADVTSASGSLYPLFMIKDAGLSIGEAPGSSEGADFEGTWSSHAQAAEALKAGQVDAAGVGRFIVWDFGADDYAEGIREVDRESGIPRAPMIVSPTLDDEEKTTLVDAMKDAPDEMYLGADGEADTDDDLWFDGVRPASLDTYQPVVDVANTLGLSTDLLDQGAAE